MRSFMIHIVTLSLTAAAAGAAPVGASAGNNTAHDNSSILLATGFSTAGSNQNKAFVDTDGGNNGEHGPVDGGGIAGPTGGLNNGAAPSQIIITGGRSGGGGGNATSGHRGENCPNFGFGDGPLDGVSRGAERAGCK